MARVSAVRGRGIVKRFDDVIALDGIDLDVAPRRIHGLVGPNGAGKTTLLGLAVADEGQLEILGTPAGRALTGPDGVSGFVDGPGLYPALTAEEPGRAGRKMSTATSCCTSIGDARNPLWRSDGVVDVLVPTSKG